MEKKEYKIRYRTWHYVTVTAVVMADNEQQAKELASNLNEQQQDQLDSTFKAGCAYAMKARLPYWFEIASVDEMKSSDYATLDWRDVEVTNEEAQQ